MDAILDGKTVTVGYQQRYYGCTPLAPLPLRTESLRIHESIEDADIGRTLSGIVLQVEKLETCHVLRTQIHLDILFVELKRPQATGLVEVLRLIQHTCLLKSGAEHFHIIRIEHARVLLDFIEVWISLELGRLMRDDGNSLRLVAPFWEG